MLLRARALHERKLAEGVIRNPCYFAMDATRPNTSDDDGPGRRFYVICEASQSFQAISAGHGAGRDLPGVVDFSNSRRCARNFGNAQDSELTAGGAYVTAEEKTTFKGYYRAVGGQDAALIRSFIQFDGEGDTANARPRAIGGHPAVTLKGLCLKKDPHSAYANPDGYVPFGTLVDYSGGRSNGCTSWSPADAPQISVMVKADPTTLYIYPEAADITAVAKALAAGQRPESTGFYWNASCLNEVGTPRFWPKEMLEPTITQYRRDHPLPPPRPLPICRE
ncbi:MAG: hypothetical protein PW843_15100 [Azospirillaceae bacterium]|nr:hypothetical protein [Azospirillaceae bacterium]